MKQEIKRGRPRKFNEAETLNRIMQVFWKNGYAATSLDQIAAETGLNRPSLYAAFGSKKDMYLASVDQFADEMHAYLQQAGTTSTGANGRLKAIMAAAIEIYTGKTALSSASYGCLAISTLPAEAAQEPVFQSALEAIIARMDSGFASLIRHETNGELTDAEIVEKAQHLALILHGISIRARAGATSDTLKGLAFSAVDRIVPKSP
jgi:TetR/AcrR family transcriptional regulator, copper-responsive repressor